MSPFTCISVGFIQQVIVLKFLLLIAQAIDIFAEARPPGIYKPDYIDALYSFYHERKPQTVVCPPTPEWKRSSEFDLNGEAVPDDDDDDGGSATSLHVCKFFDVTSSCHIFLWWHDINWCCCGELLCVYVAVST